MANIILDYTTEAQLRAALASAPKNLLERGDSLELVQTKAEIFFDAPVVLTGFTTGPESGILLSCALNASYVENPDVLTLPFAYSATAGAAWRIHGDNRPPMVTIDVPYVTVKGMQLMQSAGDTQRGLLVTGNANDFTFLHSILESSGQLQYCWPLSLEAPNGKFISSLITHRSSRESPIYMNGANALFESMTIVRTSNFTKGGSAFNIVRGGATIRNCLATGVDALTNSTNVTGDNNACSGTISFGNNKLENIVAADTFVNSVSDFRTKASSPVVDSGAAPSAGNTRAPSGVRQQGMAIDRGAWEQPSALVAPSATINNVVISGANNNDVVISGVTTGAPTEAIVSIFPANIEYNGAVGQGPVEATLTTNALSTAFQGLRVGAYGISVEVSNDAYSAAGVNAFGTFQIVGAGASTVVQEPMSGEVLTIHGTTFGNPTSGTFYLPPSDTPNGAVGQTAPLVLTPGAFTVSKAIPPGNYDEAILIFENAQGKSFPQPGTSPVSVIEISGNPQAPDPGDENPDEPDAPIALISAANRQFNVSSAAAVVVSGVVGLTATIKLVARPNAAPLSVMTGLKWAWWDQPTPDLMAAPRNKGVLGTIDPNVDLVLNIPNSALQSGGIGCVAITNDDGDAEGGHMAFFGSVRVN